MLEVRAAAGPGGVADMSGLCRFRLCRGLQAEGEGKLNDLAPSAGLVSAVHQAGCGDPGRMVDDVARDRAIYHALKAAHEVAAALQAHLVGSTALTWIGTLRRAGPP